MKPIDFQHYQSTLERAGVVFQPGLTGLEVQQIEQRYAFRFPPDYRAFLMHALPISHHFINWRNAAENFILDKLAWPSDGICFDIEHNHFWLETWGARPAQLAEALAIARQAIHSAPTLIPIAGHRYIPDQPSTAGNPVFSVYQTDIIYYGQTLFEYFENEFGYYFFGQDRYQITEPIKPIAFWSYLVDLNNGSVDDGA